MAEAKKSSRADQGEGRQIRRSPLHRSARQVAAPGPCRSHHQRGDADRRHHVRRLVDRRLEGDQRIRHDPAARPCDRGDRSVRRPAHAHPDLRRARAAAPASPTPATRARSPSTPRPISSPRGIGDTTYFGPEAEFFVFDDVRFEVSDEPDASTRSNSEEGPYVSGKKFEEGNHGHRPPIKGGYFPVPPVDATSDLRAEMLTVDGRHGHRGREAPPRSGAQPA